MPNSNAEMLARFIPVGTGNASAAKIQIVLYPVHPRGHGERYQQAPQQPTQNGSSPWARGTPDVIDAIANSMRFIPVGTGNAPQASARFALDAVHPRGHGERLFILYIHIVKCGSSPWARGTPPSTTSAKQPVRFIPVGTGNAGSRSTN